MEQHRVAAEDAARRPLSRDQAEDLVIATITRHADSVLRLARRHSLCVDDAQDAYQRAVEIFLRHAHRLDPKRAPAWLHTVAKHEAMAVRRARGRTMGSEEVDLDTFEARTSPSPEEQVLTFEHITRSAEALQRLKPNEVRALWLKAAGNSYAEICEQTGWTYTKVNRCLAEGRKRFLECYAGIEAGEECVRWQPILSAIVDGEATSEQLVDIRPHLRNCGACQATIRELHAASSHLSAVLPASLLFTATDHLEPATHFLTRIWESISMTLNDRAASTVMRTQALIETATNHKAAAVAASAVAMAGGGLAVEDATHIKRAPVVRQASHPAAPPPVSARLPTTKRAVAPRAKRATSDTSARAHEPTEAPKRKTSASSTGRRVEPLLAPVEALSVRNESVGRVQPPQKSEAASSTPSATQVAGEFGFERP
jgi:RNA polymerase sigma factor (sigma-70 family)